MFPLIALRRIQPLNRGKPEMEEGFATRGYSGAAAPSASAKLFTLLNFFCAPHPLAVIEHHHMIVDSKIINMI
jgi:hypothetical protein